MRTLRWVGVLCVGVFFIICGDAGSASPPSENETGKQAESGLRSSVPTETIQRIDYRSYSERGEAYLGEGPVYLMIPVGEAGG